MNLGFDDFLLSEWIYFFMNIFNKKGIRLLGFQEYSTWTCKKAPRYFFLLGTIGSHVIFATHAFPLPGHFRKISYWEAKVPLTIPWQSSIALYKKTEHAFPDNFLKLCTKQGPPAFLRTPFPRSTNVAKEHLSYFDSMIRRTQNKPSRPNIQVIYNWTYFSKSHHTVANVWT